MFALNKTYRETLTPDRSAKDSGHRFYSPEISRWLSRDPLGEYGHNLLKGVHLLLLSNEQMNNRRALENNDRILAQFPNHCNSAPLRAFQEALRDHQVSLLWLLRGTTTENHYTFVANTPAMLVDSLGEQAPLVPTLYCDSTLCAGACSIVPGSYLYGTCQLVPTLSSGTTQGCSLCKCL
jgi:hypothetical protein